MHFLFLSAPLRPPRLCGAFLCCFFAWGCAAPAPPAGTGGTWKAGVGRAVITPESPLRLSGYVQRKGPALEKRHDLWTKALAIEDPAGGRVVLVTADLIGMTPAIRDAVCGALARSYGLPPESVLIAVSHTHTGPALAGNLVPLVDPTPEEQAAIEAYTRELTVRMIRAAEAAVAGLSPAALSWGRSEAGFAVNRRNNPETEVPARRAAGTLKGPVDHDVPVLRVSAPDGTVRAVVFLYACHGTVLNDDQWSGDYAGWAQLDVERRHPGASALFVAGCGGDQNPLPRRKVELAEGYGRELADAVDRALGSGMTPIAGRLAARTAEIDLPFDRLPTREDLERLARGQNAQERRRARDLLARLDRDGALPASYRYPLQAWRLGDGPTLVALGGEVVVDYALRLKHELGADRTWVAAYAGDVMAYIPSERVLHEGGYEGGGSMSMYGLPARWAAGLEDRIAGKTREAVDDVRRR